MQYYLLLLFVKEKWFTKGKVKILIRSSSRNVHLCRYTSQHTSSQGYSWVGSEINLCDRPYGTWLLLVLLRPGDRRFLFQSVQSTPTHWMKRFLYPQIHLHTVKVRDGTPKWGRSVGEGVGREGGPVESRVWYHPSRPRRVYGGLLHPSLWESASSKRVGEDGLGGRF